MALVAAGPLESAVHLGNGTVFTLTKVVGGLCFVLFVLDWVATRRPLLFDGSHAILLLLLAIGLVSSIQAQSEALAYSTVVRLGSFVGLYFVVTQFVGDHRLLTRLAWVLSVASAIAAVLAIRNFVTGTALLAKPTYGDSNDLAYMLATTLPFTLWLLRGRLWKRMAAAVLSAVISSGVALSLSRGALTGLGAAAIWYILVERRHARDFLAAASVGFLVVLTLFVFLRVDGRRVEVGLTAKGKVAKANVENRLVFWRAALVMAQDNPLIGVGPGNFEQHFFVTTGRPAGGLSFVTHDAYLEIAAELGLPALVLFMAILAMAFQRLTQSIRWNRGPLLFASAARTALIVAMVGALTLSEEYYSPLWLLAGLATVLRYEGLVATDWAR